MKSTDNKSFNKFLIIWTAQLIATIASGLTAFSLAVYVFQKTQMATSVALVTLCAFLPSVLLSPVGGVLADRFDRRIMMILGDSGSALGLVFILLTMPEGNVGLWQICFGVAFGSLFIALMGPAYKATVTDLLTEDQFAKASGLVQLAASSQYLLSPVIAGFLFNLVDIKTILLIDILTLPITAFAALFVRKSLPSVEIKPEKLHFSKDLVEGWQAMACDKGVLLLVAIISVVTFYLGFMQTLLGPMLLSFTDAKTLGTVQSISATGMLLSSLLIGIFSTTQKYVAMLAAGLGFAGLFFSLMGLTSNIYFITGAGFLFFCTLPFINTSADVLIRRKIPNEKQGRAWGIIGILSQLGYIIAYAVAGILADRVFNPLLEKGGLLAPTIGKIIGTGAGRGIGLLFVICGIFIAILAFSISKIKPIRALEQDA